MSASPDCSFSHPGRERDGVGERGVLMLMGTGERENVEKDVEAERDMERDGGRERGREPTEGAH